MDPLGAMQPIVGNSPVHRRRQDEKRGSREAFERALQGEEQPSGEDPAPDPDRDRTGGPAGKRPVTPDLQNNSPDGRKDQQVRHIDVLA